MQTNNRFLDDLARLLTGAAGAAQGVRQELEQLLRSQVERMAADLALVPREEFEAVRTIALEAAERQAALEARLAALEAALAPHARAAGEARDEATRAPNGGAPV